MYTSNSLVRAACRVRPDRYLFGASVHPYRENAVACVEEVFSAGAALIKWLPLNQNIDITDPRTIAVLRCCARLGLPILVHYNAEFTLTTQHPEFIAVEPLLLVLRRLRHEGEMPITIVAHVATPVHPLGDEEPLRMLTDALLGEFAEAPLYADISALATWGKIRYLRQIARQQDLHPKLLFGTDFPVPLGLWLLRWDLGRDYRGIGGESSWPERAARVCRRMCFNEIVFHRAAALLPNIDYFAGPGRRQESSGVLLHGL
jgi:mannonate dehydratase